MMAHDGGQMMLLTAFVLVLGFVALTAMVARVSQLPEETRQASDRPIYTESAAVAKGVQQMLERIDALNAVDEDDPQGPLACDPAVDDCYADLYLGLATDAAAHLERLESARGFRLRFADLPVTCALQDLPDDGYGPRAVFSATYSLNDINTRIQFTAAYALAPAADADPGDGETDPTLYASCP